MPNLESTGHSTYAKNLARAGLLKATNDVAGDEDLVYGSKLDNALDMDVNEAAQRLMMDIKSADLPVKGRPQKYDYESDDESESEGNDDESKSELNTGFGKQEQQKEKSSKDSQKEETHYEEPPERGQTPPVPQMQKASGFVENYNQEPQKTSHCRIEMHAQTFSRTIAGNMDL